MNTLAWDLIMQGRQNGSGYNNHGRSYNSHGRGYDSHGAPLKLTMLRCYRQWKADCGIKVNSQA